MMYARACAWLMGLAAVFGALAALTLPIRLEAVDYTARPVACGSALQPDRSHPQDADRFNQRLHEENSAQFTLSSYDDECSHRITTKRGVAIMTTGLAAAIVTALQLTMRTRRTHFMAVPAQY